MGFLDFLFDRKPDRPAFARLAMEALRAGGMAEELEFDAAEFCLRTQNHGVMFLGNAYGEYCAAPRRERQGVLARLARVHVGARKDWTFDAALPNLLPRVKARSYYGLMDLRGRVEFGKEIAFPFQELAGFLAVGVVIDMPESVAELQSERLAEWKVSMDYLHDAARRNLARISDDPFQRAGRGAWVSPWRDSHDASRVVLTEVVRRLSVQGQHVAFLPNPETLVVTGSDDVDGLRLAVSITQQALAAPRSLLGRPLRLEKDQWRAFSVAAEHPLFNALERFRVDADLRDHHEQKILLQREAAARHDEVFVCTLTGLENKERGDVSTYSVWARDVVSLLPKADSVAFIWEPSGDGHALVRWEDAVRVAGGLMQEVPGVFPRRWRVDRFPDETQLQALRAVAVG